ncbi:hypothetical protein K8P03_03170 [Anaerococcus murdochii]|uniref:Uncharacterized protein n=1 Tax=Anaerococcus murdochii TaxID=411577 RepID=A0ABS7SXT3_9FIRM|nr:hypothetical protein [Anaerococcus murdochii]MBZ2386301.1 hypothetical protein [Anaerococcus murdochii]
MKYVKNNFANGLALLALICLIFKAFIGQGLSINENLIERTLTSYIIAYLAFKISYMETKKVGLIFVPLIFHSLVMALVIRGGSSQKIPSDMVQIITTLYKLLVMVGVFFAIELFFNRLLGSLATSILGGISLVIFLCLSFSKKIAFLESFEDFFLYFSFYVMAIRVRSAASLNPVLLVLSLILVAGEIYIKEKYIKIDYGFLLSIFPLSYLALKTVSRESAFDLIDHLIFALIYIYPALFVIIKASLDIEMLAISIIAILASYIIGQGIFKIKNKYLSYLLLGIN